MPQGVQINTNRNNSRTDIEKRYDDRYTAAYEHWFQSILEATKNLAFYNNIQWAMADVDYLKSKRRHAFVFNKIHKIVEAIHGYEIRNRLTLTLEGVDKTDDETASQYSQALMHILVMENAYETLSEAFKFGAIITGCNLVEPYIAYDEDLLSGDIRFSRISYDRFFLDPLTKKKDLSDCGFLMRRDIVGIDDAKRLAPQRIMNDLKKISQNGYFDSKYPEMSMPYGFTKTEYVAYDEFWEKQSEQYKVLIVVGQDGQPEMINPRKGKMRELKERLALNGFQVARELAGEQPLIKKHVFINGVHVATDENPYGLRRFPHVAEWGYFSPEANKPDVLKNKIRGLVSILRDPQEAYNISESQMRDIFETQLNTGTDAEEDAFVDPMQAAKTGQGGTRWLKKGALGAGKIRDRVPAQIPQSMFQLAQNMDTDIKDIAGAGAELLGEDSKDIPVSVAMLRQGASLTMIQPLFENHRNAKKNLGRNVTEMMVNEYQLGKIQRITNRQPTEAMQNKTFNKFDVVPTEGLLTETQKKGYGAKLMELVEKGVPIPPMYLMDYLQLERKDELKQYIQQQERAQQQQAQQGQQLQALQLAMLQAELEKDRSQTAERNTQAEWNKVRAVQDAQEVESNSVRNTIELIDKIIQRRQSQQPAGASGATRAAA